MKPAILKRASCRPLIFVIPRHHKWRPIDKLSRYGGLIDEYGVVIERHQTGIQQGCRPANEILSIAKHFLVFRLEHLWHETVSGSAFRLCRNEQRSQIGAKSFQSAMKFRRHDPQTIDEARK